MRRLALLALVLVVAAGGVALGLFLSRDEGYDVPPSFVASVSAPAATTPFPMEPSDAELATFTALVSSDVQGVWKTLFAQASKRYELAKVRQTTGGEIPTGCGPAPAGIGPFYCPIDHGIFLDMTFYRDMRRAMGELGDAGWAYVIGHEFGHHVQQVTGVLEQVQAFRDQDTNAGKGDSRAAVRAELQADCYSGVWAHTALQRGQYSEQDFRGALHAASAIGDDRLQRLSGKEVVDPDLFTHGTSEQRTRWFMVGYRSGSPASCDSFSPSEV